MYIEGIIVYDVFFSSDIFLPYLVELACGGWHVVE